jgi:hypothetical protein
MGNQSTGSESADAGGNGIRTLGPHQRFGRLDLKSIIIAE